ncbi:MAG TPA: nitroreductase [Rudaea sp.]|nr:nitroreductase [Rudaea sp.]
MNFLDFLEQRRSVPSRLLGEPGPTPEQLDRLLTAAIRVPDHGKLTPWRLLLIRGQERARLGAALAEIHGRADPGVPPAVVQKDRERFNFAPLIVAVVARVEPNHPKVPEQEQVLSAGCIAYNLLLGAQALGFGAQILTGWAAYDREVARLLGLGDRERIVAFVHIGTAREVAPERIRPAISSLVSEWNPVRAES